ncbi:MAG TPA: hypothetical protein VGC66_22220 [Pyrinomonadaceae bacterium]|jgi:hypothetical protein
MLESQSSVNNESSLFSRVLDLSRSFARTINASGAIIYFLIALNLSITVPLSYILSIITDEAFSLHTTSKGIGYAFNQALYFELQAPLYFILLNIWREANGSIFFARLFSVLCIAATVKVAACLSQRLVKGVHPGWFAAVVALHPYTIWAATEIRLYALGILLSSLLLLFFYDGFFTDKPRRGAQVIYFVLSVAALYTQYYLGFLLVANAAALLILRRWRAAFIYMLGMVGVGLCFAPMLLVILGQVTTHTQTVTNAVSAMKGLSVIFWHIKEYILPVTPLEKMETLEVLRRWIFRLAYVAIIIALLKNYRRFLTATNILVVTTLSITVLLYVAAVRLTGEAMLQYRHSFVLFIPTALLAFTLVAKAAGGKVRAAWMLIFLLFSLTSLYFTFNPMTKMGSWDKVAQYVMASEKPGQPVLVFHAGNALTLSYYYTGKNVLVPVPRENRFDTFDIKDYVLKDEQEIEDAIARVPGDHREIWLVTDGICRFMDVDYNCQVLDGFVEKHYDIEQSQTFYNSQVRLLRRKPNP